MDENKKQAEATVTAMKTAEAMNGVATALTPAATDDTTAAELASPAYTARKVEECPDCKELVHGLQQHRSTCQAIKDLRAKAAEVVRTMAITSPAGSSNGSNGSGPRRRQSHHRRQARSALTCCPMPCSPTAHRRCVTATDREAANRLTIMRKSFISGVVAAVMMTVQRLSYWTVAQRRQSPVVA
jgi:hypothetical protein